jgi:hypothetical protein
MKLIQRNCNYYLLAEPELTPCLIFCRSKISCSSFSSLASSKRCASARRSRVSVSSFEISSSCLRISNPWAWRLSEATASISDPDLSLWDLLKLISPLLTTNSRKYLLTLIGILTVIYLLHLRFFVDCWMEFLQMNLLHQIQQNSQNHFRLILPNLDFQSLTVVSCVFGLW